MTCVLPHNNHGCCATHLKGGTPSLSSPQSCEHTVRAIAISPVIPITAALQAAKIRPAIPVLNFAPPAARMAIETASPPSFHLRI